MYAHITHKHTHRDSEREREKSKLKVFPVLVCKDSGHVSHAMCVDAVQISTRKNY